jgi:phosphopantothenoylcysteine decarboxylase/phosphopantothenate--cysteine ligase
MQPSISGSVSDHLSGKLVVVGVTGSIAAVRTVDLIRDLIRRGAEVRCVMSKEACRILHPNALSYASGNPVITEITGQVEHVELCGDDGAADLLLLAPATANTIGKVANGIDDTPVTTFATTAIGSKKKVMVVPAMHDAMYRHPAVCRNVEILRSMGVVVVDPRREEGKAKIANNSNIVLNMERLLGKGDLLGKKVLITSGATAERVDPIRILTNRASGKTGTLLALEAYRRGAEVTIVHKNIDGLPFKEIAVESAEEMLQAVLGELDHSARAGAPYHAMISAAAIGDYTLDQAATKIKSGGDLTLTLRPTRKVIRAVREAYPGLKIVGFKAETNVTDEELKARAVESMMKARSDLVVANDVGKGGMGTADNRAAIINGVGDCIWTSGKKENIARAVINALSEVMM